MVRGFGLWGKEIPQAGDINRTRILIALQISGQHPDAAGLVAFVLNAFIEDVIVELAEHIRKSIYHKFRIPALRRFNDHTAVKFDDIEGQLHDTLHIGVAGAEVIQIKGDAVFFQMIDLVAYHIKICFILAFREFHGNFLKWYIVRADHPDHIIAEIIKAQLLDGEIHGDAHEH